MHSTVKRKNQELRKLVEAEIAAAKAAWEKKGRGNGKARRGRGFLPCLRVGDGSGGVAAGGGAYAVTVRRHHQRKGAANPC